MIISAEEVMAMPSYQGLDEPWLRLKLDAIETAIRKHTNNNFLVRGVHFSAPASAGVLHGTHAHFKPGSTVFITGGINEGLYEVVSTDSETTRLNQELFDAPSNSVSLVRYTKQIKDGVLSLLDWEVKYRDKVGIKSESLSRHTVTYFDMDTDNTVDGYPVALMAFLKPYIKARF